MKLVFPSDGQELINHIDQRFGRCAYFLSYNTDTKAVNAISNEQNYQAVQGAGIQAATQVANMKADVCITGHCGPKAFKVFQAAGVKVIIGINGTIKDAINDFLAGKLTFSSEADVKGHWV